MTAESPNGGGVVAIVATPAAPALIPSKIELSENFYISNKNKQNVKIQVKLSGEGIYLRRETEQQDHINEQLIRIEDIIGSRCGPRLKKRTSNVLNSCRRVTNDEPPAPAPTVVEAGAKVDSSAYLHIYAYLKTEKPLRRNRTVRILRFRSTDSFEHNMKVAERWHNGIKLNKGRRMDGKQLLILLNPKSGSGKGRAMFQKEVTPVLKEAEVQYELHVTTHPNFAREFVRKRRDLLQRYNGIVVASGDGLFYEVLNGLMERSDWRAVTRELPIGIIPCGSGNGLAKSISYLYGEPFEPEPLLYATLNCVSGRSELMDIVRVELGKADKHQEMYSFLSVGWGLIADIDIESERLRSIGTPRFTVWSVHRLISLRTQKGKLWYLPCHEEPAAVMSKTLPVLARNGIAAMTADDNMSEFCDMDEDDFTDAISLDEQSERPPADSWHSASSRRTAYYSIAGQSMRSRRSVNASISSKIEAANTAYQMRAPPSSIPPLNEPLPIDDWVYEEGEYVMVHSGYTTHLSSDALLVPQSRFNDGIIYLVIIRAGVGRRVLMNFLLSLSSGTHMPEPPNEYIRMVAVRAFRIEPSEPNGIITVDGERVEYGPIQCEVLPGMINVMVPNGQQK